MMNEEKKRKTSKSLNIFIKTEKKILLSDRKFNSKFHVTNDKDKGFLK